MAAARLRQRTGGQESVMSAAHRYSIASTSATLVTCPCEADELGDDGDCQVHTRSFSKASGHHVQDKDNDRACTAEEASSSVFGLNKTDFSKSKERIVEVEDDAASVTSSALERRYRGMSDEEEDQLDRLIRLSTALLSVSKSILGNAKRLAVSESAWSQTAFGQEQEMQRTLESLETQERFLALMSRDAHAMSFPASSSEIGGLHSTAGGTLPAEVPAATSGSQLLRSARHRRSNMSISASAPRARTMYINASAALPAMSPLQVSNVDEPGSPKGQESRDTDGRKEAGKPRISKGKMSSRTFGSIAEEVDGMPESSEAEDVETLASPISSNGQWLSPPPATGTPSSRSHQQGYSSRASLDSLLQKSAAQSAKRAASPSPTSTSITSPSSFFSSFFSGRSHTSSATSTAASTPVAEQRKKSASTPPATASASKDERDPEAKVTTDKPAAKSSAQGLLAALAGGSAPSSVAQIPAYQAPCQPSDMESPFSTISQAYTAPSGTSSQEKDRVQAGPSSPSPSGPFPSNVASAQLSLIHSASPHLTIAHRNGRKQTAPDAPDDSTSTRVSQGEQIGLGQASSARPTQKRPRHRTSLSESLLRASIGSSGTSGHRATGSVSVAKEGQQVWISKVPLNSSLTPFEG